MTHWAGYGYRTDPAGDTARREGMAHATVTPDEWRAARAGLAADRAVQPDPEPVPGHHLTAERHGTATIARCECGRWDGGWTGARSRRRVLDDHAEHVAAELAAAGPLRVISVRADQHPEETDP